MEMYTLDTAMIRLKEISEALESGEYANVPFYIDSIMLVEDYTSFSK